MTPERDQAPRRLALTRIAVGWRVASRAVSDGLSLAPAAARPGPATTGRAPGTSRSGAALDAPGEVIGLALADEQLAVTRALAARRSVANSRFDRGDIDALPHADAGCDAAFAHNVLEHLRDPLAAPRELRRVLRPGGVVRVLDNDWAPSCSRRRRPASRRSRWPRRSWTTTLGFFEARHKRQLLRGAGFVRTEGHGVAEVVGVPERARLFVAAGAQQFHEPDFVAAVLEQGWADRATPDPMAANLEAWGEDPDASCAMLNPAAVGWVWEDLLSPAAGSAR